MKICRFCRTEIDTFASVCPNCTSSQARQAGEYAYGSGGEFQLVDMLVWAFVLGIIFKACELMGCSVR